MKLNHFKNLFLLGQSSFINLSSIFLLQYILSIFLDVDTFGIYSSIISICFILLPLINFGFSPYVIKNNFQNNISHYENLSKTILALIFLSIIFFLFLLVILYFILEIKSIFITFFFSLHLLALAYFEIIYSFYQSQFNYVKILLISILFNLLKVVLVFYLIFLNYNLNLITLSFVYFISSILILFIFILKFRDIIFNNKNINIFTVKKYILIIKETYKFGIHGSVFYIYYFFDIIIIFLFGNEILAGNYSLTLSILFLIYLFPTIIIDKYFINQFHIYFNQKKYKNLLKIRNYLIAVFIFCSLILYLFVIYFSDTIISYLYSEKFSHLYDLLAVMSISIFFRYITIIFNGTLYLGNYLKICSFTWLFISLLKIFVNTYLLINYNIMYLAYSFVSFEFLILLIFMYFHIKTLKNA